MKHAVRLTREQKILLSEQGLHPEDWLLAAEEPDKLIIVQRDGGARTVVHKVRRGGRE